MHHAVVVSEAEAAVVVSEAEAEVVVEAAVVALIWDHPSR